MTPEMNFNQKNRRKIHVHERKRQAEDSQKGIWKEQEMKKIDLSLEGKKKHASCQNTET